MPDMVNLEQYYTAKEAAEVLSRNSGKKIDAAYVRTLAKYGKFHPKSISNRVQLYPKVEVDAYVVEGRGEKSGRAARTRKSKKKELS